MTGIVALIRLDCEDKRSAMKTVTRVTLVLVLVCVFLYGIISFYKSDLRNSRRQFYLFKYENGDYERIADSPVSDFIFLTETESSEHNFTAEKSVKVNRDCFLVIYPLHNMIQ